MGDHELARKDGNRRTLRTAYAALVALLTATPVIVGMVPVDLLGDSTEAQLVAFSAWIVFVNKAITKLEDFGVIPAWLRDANNRKEN
jgi:hypothetical protein